MNRAGQEQAILLLVTLDDKSIVDRLLSLLAATPEVHMTAAWGLSRLQVSATLEPMLVVFTATTDRWPTGNNDRDRVQEQLSHFAQAFGRMKYRPADAGLRRYVPKNSGFPPVSHAAAIWGLGWIHAEQFDEQLATSSSGGYWICMA